MADTNDANGTTEPAAAAESTSPKSYDILPKLIPNLDRHLIFPLLEFLEGQETAAYSAQEMLQSKYDLLKHTNMTDFVGSLYAQLHGSEEVPEEFVRKRESVLEQLKALEEKSLQVTSLLENEEVITNLRSDKAQNMKYLEEKHGVTGEMVNTLFDFGQMQFSCGNYAAASDLLYQFRILVRAVAYGRRKGTDGGIVDRQ